MTRRNILTSLTLALAIVAMTNTVSFAETGSHTVQLANPVTLNGALLAAGRYKVNWESHSPEVTVTFLKDKNVVATAEGRLEERELKYNRDAVIYRVNPDGTMKIIEMRFKNKNRVIVFNQ
jgi:hypothetical protein